MGGRELDAIEREVRRRLADRLASAGVDQGRISLEILWQLPPEFVRTYRRLWEKALRPEVQSGLSKEADPRAKNAPDRKTGGATRQAWRSGARRGNRHAAHWVVKDERLLELKVSLDRKLRRIAANLELELEGRETQLGRDSAREESSIRAGVCPGCLRPLAEEREGEEREGEKGES